MIKGEGWLGARHVIYLLIYGSCIGLYIGGEVAYARTLTISGTVSNLQNTGRGAVVRVYSPGYPFYGSDPDKEWSMLASSPYDLSTGRYSVSVEVPETAAALVIAAEYRAGHTDVSRYVRLTSESRLTTDFTLPDRGDRALSFRFRLYHEDVEFDYRNSYACMVANSRPHEDGRIILFSIANAELFENEVYGLTPGEYRLACLIENRIQDVPNPLNRFIEVTVPLVNEHNIPLPEAERIVDLRFGGCSENGKPL